MAVENTSANRPDAPGAPAVAAGPATTPPTIEAPVRSVGWGAFFLVAAALALGLDVTAWVQRGYEGWPQSSLVLGPSLVYYGRRLLARPALQAVLEDPRAPVIYFRSFAYETLEAATQTGRAGQLPAETRLVPALERIGPVLAIGRPGERLTVPGAARLYVGDDDWKRVALGLMRQARLVVVRADAGLAGTGLAWEVSTAREAVPPDRLAVWLPRRPDAQALEKLRALVRAAAGSEVPAPPAKGGFLRFGPSWQAYWSASLDDMPAVPRPALTAASTAASAAAGTAAGTAAGPAPGPAAASPLKTLLSELRAQEVAPPRFALQRWVWAIGLAWLVAVLGGGVLFATQAGRGGPLAAAALEAAFAGISALALAFVCHVKWPHQRLGSSLIVAAVLAADASWYVTRHWPSEAEVDEVADNVAAQLCGQAFACVPPDLRDDAVEQCVAEQRDEIGRSGLAMLYVQQSALAACEALECEAFLDCVDREAGLLLLPAAQKRQLLALICRALKESPAPDPASPAWTEAEQALEALDNEPLGQALIEEAQRSCAAGER